MHRVVSSGLKQRNYRHDSFTLIELLVVMAIIAILVALTLAAGSGVMTRASRARAANEIQAIGSALESYKNDNGTYPSYNMGATNSYSLNPGVTYQTASEALYQALEGETNYYDTPVAGTKNYLTGFTTKQLGGYKIGTGPTYLQDPWGYPYGYNTGDTAVPQVNAPYNGTGFFDLWSTGGITAATTSNPNPTNSWITNWH